MPKIPAVLPTLTKPEIIKTASFAPVVSCGIDVSILVLEGEVDDQLVSMNNQVVPVGLWNVYFMSGVTPEFKKNPRINA